MCVRDEPTITLLRHDQRRYVRRGGEETWQSFFVNGHTRPHGDRFGLLVAFDEVRLPTGQSGGLDRDGDVEQVLYVCHGALSQQDTAGASEVIDAGEFQRVVTGARLRRRVTTVSRSDAVQLYRISLRPSEVGLDRHREQRRFTTAQRRNQLCVVASPDGRKGSLRIAQDALILSSIVDPGHHLFHALEPGRSAWLHIVCGQITLDGIVLTEGDGVGVANAAALSLTVQQSAELLIVDLGPTPANPWARPRFAGTREGKPTRGAGRRPRRTPTKLRGERNTCNMLAPYLQREHSSAPLLKMNYNCFRLIAGGRCVSRTSITRSC